MIIDIAALVIFGVYMVVLTLLVVDAVKLRVRLAKTTKINTQLVLDRDTYLSKLNEIIANQDNQSIEETQGFLKFVTESRDWAFQYIEDAQQAIEEYRQIADVVPLSHDMSVEQAKKLSKAYDRLIDLLPKDDLL